MTKASRCPLRSSASQISYHKLENKEFAYVCLGFSLKLWSVSIHKLYNFMNALISKGFIKQKREFH